MTYSATTFPSQTAVKTVLILSFDEIWAPSELLLPFFAFPFKEISDEEEKVRKHTLNYLKKLEAKQDSLVLETDAVQLVLPRAAWSTDIRCLNTLQKTWIIVNLHKKKKIAHERKTVQ